MSIGEVGFKKFSFGTASWYAVGDGDKTVKGKSENLKFCAGKAPIYSLGDIVSVKFGAAVASNQCSVNRVTGFIA
jgi:hypothetical protein